MICFHKLGHVKEGYQYCIKCGKAFVAPCVHDWILVSSISKKYDWSYRLVYGEKEDFIKKVYECSKCKEIKKVEF